MPFNSTSLNNLYLQEFAIVIPDAEADEIQTVDQGVYFFPRYLGHSMTLSSAIDYIAKTPEGLLLFFKSFLILAHAIYSQVGKAGTERRGTKLDKTKTRLAILACLTNYNSTSLTYYKSTTLCLRCDRKLASHGSFNNSSEKGGRKPKKPQIDYVSVRKTAADGKKTHRIIRDQALYSGLTALCEP